MKIENTVKTVGAKPTGQMSRPASGSAASKASAPGAQVELSPIAAQLHQAVAADAAGGVFNAEKVAEIRQAIAEGRFKINPERIADSLVESVRDMLSQRRGPA